MQPLSREPVPRSNVESRNRRRFLTHTSGALLGTLVASARGGVRSAPPGAAVKPENVSQTTGDTSPESRAVTLFVCGDVMTGRGIDQILPHPSKPHLYEPYMRSALDYVGIAERATGPIKRPVNFEYIWGDALVELERVRPDARIINLESAVTAAEDAWSDKGIHYRMHPANVPCLTAAKIDCCVLANNHVLDWGYSGLSRCESAGREDLKMSQ